MERAASADDEPVAKREQKEPCRRRLQVRQTASAHLLLSSRLIVDRSAKASGPKQATLVH